MKPFSPLKLIVFRIFNLTVGRIPALNTWVRKRLAQRLILGKKGGDRYVASSQFFHPDDLF